MDLGGYIMKITFGFSKAKAWYKLGSKIIALAESRPYSHVFIKYEDEVFQASHGKVHTVKYEEFLKDNEVIKTYSVEYNHVEYESLILFKDSMDGRPYSRMQIVLLTLLKLFNIKLKISINGKSEFICSELAADVLSIKYGIISNDTITPSDFEQILIENGIQEDGTSN